MLPQIVFNPEFLGNYFPEPDFWQAPEGRLTSGITMPPLHAIACLHILENAQDEEEAFSFLRKVFPDLLASHRYFYEYRDPNNEGLVYIRHPWESGIDNSPNWDATLRAIKIDKNKLPPYERRDVKHGIPAEERPSDEDYDRYVFLVDLFRRNHYDEKAIFDECPFLIQDSLFNSILCRANQALLEIANHIGEDSSEIREWTDQTTRAIGTKLWCDRCRIFECYDLVRKSHIHGATAAGFIPLFAGAASREQAKILYEHMNSIHFCALHQGNCFTIPNFDMIHTSVKEVADFFQKACYQIGPHRFSPDDIEHGILRGNARPPYRPFRQFKKRDPRLAFAVERVDARIHFALVCGSRSCAPIRFYDPNEIEQQLELAAYKFVNSSEVVIAPEEKKVIISQVFDWYQRDFGGKKVVLKFIKKRVDSDWKREFLTENIDQVKVEYLFYDWNLNH